MYELIKLFYNIALFQKGPQDVPSSAWLLRMLIVVYVVINFMIVNISVDPFGAFLQAAVEALMTYAFAWGVLFFIGRPARFRQTAAALFGTDALISFFALPAMATLTIQASVLALVVVVGLMLWHWLVTGHILRHAMEQPLIFALGVAFLYILVAYQVMAFLFPEMAADQGG